MAKFTINDKVAVTSINAAVDVVPIWQGGAQKKATARQFIEAGVIATNTTITVAAAGGDFTSVQAAITSLDNSIIGAAAFITLEVDDGTFASVTPILMEGPYGRNITVRGKNSYARTINSIQSSSGSAGAWSIVLNMSSVANIAVNDYIVLKTPITGGTHPEYLAGAHKITNVDAVNTRITIASKHKAAVAPSGAVTCSGRVLKSILTFTGCDGVQIWEGGTALNLYDVMLVGDGNNVGISVQDVGRCLIGDPGAGGTGGTVGVAAFNVGAWGLYNSEFNGDTIVVSGCTQQGFLMDTGACCALWTACASGNGDNGFSATNGGIIWAMNPMISTGNSAAGFRVGLLSSIDAANSISTGNTGYGYYSESNGLVTITNAAPANNTAGDYYPPQYPPFGTPYGGFGGFSGIDGVIGAFGPTRASMLIGSKYGGGSVDNAHIRFITGNLSVSDAAAATIAHIYSQQTTGDSATGGELYIQTRVPSGSLNDRLVITDSDLSIKRGGYSHSLSVAPWNSGVNIFNNAGSNANVYFGRDASSNNNFQFTNYDNSATVFTIDTSTQNVVQGTAAIATNATTGFFHIATCAGTPTGTPANTYTGRVPMVYDTTANRLWIYTGGTWRYAAFT